MHRSRRVRPVCRHVPCFNKPTSAAVLVALVVCLAQVTHAADIHVADGSTGTYATLAEALDVALDGDRILIAPGDYGGPGVPGWSGLVVNDTRMVSIIGTGGKGVTNIDAFFDFFIHFTHVPGGLGDSGGRTHMLSGVTVTNAFVTDGTSGAVVLAQAVGVVVDSVDVYDCYLFNPNGASTRTNQLPDPTKPPVGGCAVAAFESPVVVIRDMTIGTSDAADGAGGALLLYASGNVTVRDVTITEGGASQGGAIALIKSGNITMTDVVITESRALGAGGGLFVQEVSGLTTSQFTCTGCQSLRGAGMYLFKLTDSSVNDTTIAESAPLPGAPPIFLFGGGVYLVASSARLNRLTVRDSASVDGTVYALDDGAGTSETSVITECTIENNSARLGGAVLCLRGAHTTFTGCTITGNTATEGAGVYAQDGSACVVQDTNIVGNAASSSGGGVLLTGGGVLACDGCKVELNTAKSGAGIVVQSSATLSSSRGITVHNNSAGLFGGGMFVTDSATVTVTNSRLTHNRARVGGAVFTAGQATVTVMSSYIGNNVAARSGGAIFSNAASVVNVNGTLFNSNAAQSGGAVYFDGTQVWSFFRSNFTSNIALGSGGAMRLQTASQTRVAACNFVNNSAGDNGGAIAAGLESGGLGLSNPALHALLKSAGFGGGMAAGEVTVTIRDCSFIGNHAAGTGGAVMLDMEHAINITRTEMRGNAASVGGALHVVSTTQGVVDNLVVTRNSAVDGGGGVSVYGGVVLFTDSTASRNVAGQFGGGVLVSAYGRVEWIRGAMSLNKAGASGGGVACMALLKLSGASLTQNQAVDGGAVYFGQTPAECAASTLTALTVSSNKASRGGGALFNKWEVPSVTTAGAVCTVACSGCSMASNTALYGNDEATPPAHLLLAPTQNKTTSPIAMFMLKTLVKDLAQQMTNGPLMDITVALDKVSSNSSCRLFTHHNSRSSSSTGMIMLTGLQLYAARGSTCVIDVAGQPQLGGLPAPIQLIMEVKGCPPGYAHLADGSCRVCPEDQYNINGDGVCRPCPEGALCTGGNAVRVAAGRWANAPGGVIQVFECPPAFCCDQASCPLDTMCSPFRQGDLCGTCEDDRTDVAGTCVKCETTNWGIVSVLFITCVIVMLVFVVATFESRNPLLTQVTFAAQTAAIVVPIDKAAKGVNGVLGVMGVNLASLLAAMGSVNSSGDDQGLCLAPMTPVESAGSLLSIPVILGVALLLILACHACGLCVYNKYGSRVRGFRAVGLDWSRYRNGIFTLVMLTYSTVGDAALKIVVCGDVLDNGQLRMVAQPSVVCYEGSHWGWAILSWVVVAVWVIGIPVFIFFFLRRKQKQLGKPLDEDEDSRRNYGPLFTPFKQTWYWFFAFNLTRRSVILGASSLLFDQPVPRLFSLTCILAVFLAVHAWVQPFKDWRDNLGGLVILSCLTLLSCAALISATAPPDFTADLSSEYAFVLFFQGFVAVVLVLWMVVALVDLTLRTVKEATEGARARLVAMPARSTALSGKATWSLPRRGKTKQGSSPDTDSLGEHAHARDARAARAQAAVAMVNLTSGGGGAGGRDIHDSPGSRHSGGSRNGRSQRRAASASDLPRGRQGSGSGSGARLGPYQSTDNPLNSALPSDWA